MLFRAAASKLTLLLSVVASMALLSHQAHAHDDTHHGIRNLKGKKGGKEGGKTKSKKGGTKKGGSGATARMSCEGIPDEMVQTFMSSMMLKSESTTEMMSTMQDMSDGSFMMNGKTYSMDDMEPVSMLTDDATIDVDGDELDRKLYPPPTVFGSSSDGMRMLVTTTLEGDVDTVVEMDTTGVTTAQMQAISPGCMVTITPEMMDKEKLSEFNLGDNLAPGTEDNTRRLETSPLDDTTPRQLQACASLRVIEVAFGADSTFCSKAGGRSNAIAKIRSIVALASMHFEVPGICARIAIKFCDIQCNAATDHYVDSLSVSRTVDCFDFLNSVKDLWLNQNQYLNSKRGDTTHVFTGNPVDDVYEIGCAFEPALCDSFSFGVNQIFFSENIALQVSLFAQELGHNTGR